MAGARTGCCMPRTRSHTPLHRGSRGGAVAVAALCLAAQLAAWLHLLAVPHARCEAHGEAIHRLDGASIGEPSRRSLAGALAPGELRAVRDTAGKGDHAHEHCRVLSDRAGRCCDASATLGRPTPTAAELLQVAPAAPPVARPLYRLAPKLSPPAG
jgi:hypothetical protein